MPTPTLPFEETNPPAHMPVDTVPDAMPDKQAIIERILERVSETHGDITGPVMAEVYRTHPDARAIFETLGTPDVGQLEGSMVMQTLYCIMTWFEAPDDVLMIMEHSLPHHVSTLQVSRAHFIALFSAVFSVVGKALPEDDLTGRHAWQDLSHALHTRLMQTDSQY